MPLLRYRILFKDIGHIGSCTKDEGRFHKELLIDRTDCNTIGVMAHHYKTNILFCDEFDCFCEIGPVFNFVS